MKFYSFCCRFILLLFLPVTSYAGFIDLNFLSFSDSFQEASTKTISRSMYDVGIGILMGKSESWLWTINYGGGTFSDADSTTTTKTYAYTDLGFKVGFFWTKQKTWFSTLTYNLDSRAKYNNGTNEAELRGTSIKVDVGYSFWPSDTVGVAAKIFYYAPTFKESIASATLTQVSYRRSVIYPSISLLFSF